MAQWIKQDLPGITPEPARRVLGMIANDFDEFVSWPQRAILLWSGCVRPARGKHTLPEAVKSRAKNAGIKSDSRTNGPAIMAFQLAGGHRPTLVGGSKSWSVHHIYCNKFPKGSLHAVKDGLHFTQSAGLVAIHPLADAIADEIPNFAWHLRRQAFERFGYDPDGVWCSCISPYGFAEGHTPPEVIV